MDRRTLCGSAGPGQLPVVLLEVSTRGRAGDGSVPSSEPGCGFIPRVGKIWDATFASFWV